MAAEMKQFASSNPADTHTLSKVPLRMGGEIDVVDITISQRPDGSDWLLGNGTSGKASSCPTLVSCICVWTTLLQCLVICVTLCKFAVVPLGRKVISSLAFHTQAGEQLPRLLTRLWTDSTSVSDLLLASLTAGSASYAEQPSPRCARCGQSAQARRP